MSETEMPDTPLFQQYSSLKKSYPDAFLFFRLGDFYEMFFEDAAKASAILGLTLTHRQKVPMCGVPHHSCTGYISRMLAAGHKVAICEQVSATAESNGKKPKLFRREVIRLITPGTVVEDELLEPKTAKILVAISADIAGWGFASFDASTGDFLCTQNTNDPGLYQLSSLVSRADPAEIIADSSTITQLKSQGADFSPVPITEFNNFEEENLPWAQEAVWQNHRQAMKTALEVNAYVRKTLPGIKDSFVPAYFEPGTKLQLDNSAIRTLELVSSPDGDTDKTLWGVLNLCRTSMGTRMLRRWILEPLGDLNAINTRQKFTAFLFDNASARDRLKDVLSEIPDVERLLGRLMGLTSSPRDLSAIRAALSQMDSLRSLLQEEDFFKAAPDLHSRIEKSYSALSALLETLKKALSDNPPLRLSDGGVIRSGYNAELDELRAVRRDSQKFLNDIEAKEREKNQIPNLKVGYNSVFGYFIEVSKANAAKVPAYFVRKQTLVNAERFITEELKELENKILGAEEKTARLEAHLFGEIREAAHRAAAELKMFAGAAAELDVFYSFAEAAVIYEFTRPEIVSDGTILLEDGRHPVVERLLPSGEYVPNDLSIGGPDNGNVIILTGPNMSGKSVYLRQAAVAVIMAQMGGFVAAKKAVISVTDRIMTRIGAQDRMAAGESTFMVEMKETSSILKLATSKSLVLLDEIGRGTSTFDGISIAWAVAEYLYKGGKGPRVLFATHYFELTELADKFKGIRNCNISVKEWTDSSGKTEVVFLHKINNGPADKSYGIHVARLAGLPDKALGRARQILQTLQRKGKIEVESSEYDEAPLLPMFSSHPVLDEIKMAQPENLTPLQALALITEWKKRI
ncbi:MAG: DNA mismatch repair protein MutS [Elusimicrobiales bacterium]|nr:DNA mismatch repair protein MutS [Elusimicrobiales bacterium]